MQVEEKNGSVASPEGTTEDSELVDRRRFLRRLMEVGYAAPVVSTVLLSTCQPQGPSGGMQLSAPAPGEIYCSDQDPNLPPCPPGVEPVEQRNTDKKPGQ